MMGLMGRLLLIGLVGLALGCAASGTSNTGVLLADGGSGSEGDGGPARIDRDGACETVRLSATLSKAPVDVVFVVDNSLSMTSEIQSVQDNINRSFSDLIAKSGLDYRVIMLSHHGSANADQSICISAPLSGAASCSPPPAMPQLTPRFFHYSVEVRSTDPYDVILKTYSTPDEFKLAPSGWKQWLRPDAFKTFVLITDDESYYPAKFLDDGLLQHPEHFGTAAVRNYRVHSICGIAENTPPTAPYQPSDPVVPRKCSGSQTVGLEHQALARLTGGLRYPVCQFSTYDAVFQAVADGVIRGAKVSCEFDFPPPPQGKVYRVPQAELEYFPGSGGPSKLLRQVAGAAACAPDAFYVVGTHVSLCPDACGTISADAGARVEFLIDCDVLVG